MLSPHLFGIFINDLLIDLSTGDHGVRIGSNKFESFAYADDINLFSATVPGLQKIIDKCLVYSNTWRFKFGIEKTKCISYGQTILTCEPKCINQVDSRILKLFI